MSEPISGLQRAHMFIESLPEGVVTLDGGGQVLFLNRAAERICGWSVEEARGRSIDEVLTVAPGQETIFERIQHVTSIPPVNARNRQGQDITLAISTGTVDIPEEPAARTVLVVRDMTTEDAAQRLRSYFLANISHEFRTPLSALKASVELLLEGVDGFTLDETLELVRSIHFSVTSLQTLVDNLLESVSIEAGRFRIRRRPTDVSVLVADAAMLMKPLLERRSQTLVTSVPASPPQLSADPMRLTQVLVNLLSNASKYGPVDEPIELTVEVQQDSLKLSVADHGSGVPASEKDSIFRRFVRFDAKDNAQYGVGLGLSVVKTIVESHGGTLGLQERPGGGSVFWFTIPLEEPSE